MECCSLRHDARLNPRHARLARLVLSLSPPRARFARLMVCLSLRHARFARLTVSLSPRHALLTRMSGTVSPSFLENRSSTSMPLRTGSTAAAPCVVAYQVWMEGNHEVWMGSKPGGGLGGC